MTSTNRTALLNKTHKVLKKHYKLILPRGEQPLLDALLFACCLENARQPTAEAVFEKVKTSFFDWNEVRVSTVKELSEVMTDLPEPAAAATRLKGILQSVFESEYSFDLEALKKQNIGQAVKKLQKLDGATAFNVAYAVQTALGGHSIPIDLGTLKVLVVLGVINENEARAGTVPGLERAIPKSKGQEFGGLLHQLGAEFFASPFSLPLRDLLLSIAADAKERFPKRMVKKPIPVMVEKKKSERPAPVAAAKEKPAAKKPEPAPRKPEAAPRKSEPAPRKPETTAKKPEPARKPEPAKKVVSTKKKPAAKPLARRKPR